jgi:hypothetical protein
MIGESPQCLVVALGLPVLGGWVVLSGAGVVLLLSQVPQQASKPQK